MVGICGLTKHGVNDMKKYYAFEYSSGRNTTTGQPNESTGRMSTAGRLAVFHSQSDRNKWVDDGRYTSDMGGCCRESVTSVEARRLHAGQSVADYNEFVAMLEEH